MTNRIQARPINLTLVQVYAPTVVSSDKDIGEFYEQLQETLDGIPNDDMLILIGNFDAKVGTQKAHGVTGGFGLCVRNDAGECFTNFCTFNELVIMNTIFLQHLRRPAHGQHQVELWKTKLTTCVYASD